MSTDTLHPPIADPVKDSACAAEVGKFLRALATAVEQGEVAWMDIAQALFVEDTYLATHTLLETQGAQDSVLEIADRVCKLAGYNGDP